MSRLSHLDETGAAHMVDVGDKPLSKREAVATGHIRMQPATLEIIRTEDPNLPGLCVSATVAVSGQTGVEMEALTAVSVCCLTIYDMVKAVDRSMEIGAILLQEKQGGRSGHFTRSSV